MTELAITFDGQDLTLLSDGNEIARFDAYSGHGAYQDPQFQNYADHGPIPEGSYSFTLNDIQQPSAIDIFLSPFGMGAWPAWGGNEVGWGTMRAPLTPSEGTETYGRSGFFIHGGQNPGSAGCIDVTTNDIALFSFIKVYEDSDGIIPVIVSYSPPIQSNSLDTALSAAQGWTRHDPGGASGGGRGGGSGVLAARTVLLVAGSTRPPGRWMRRPAAAGAAMRRTIRWALRPATATGGRMTSKAPRPGQPARRAAPIIPTTTTATSAMAARR